MALKVAPCSKVLETSPPELVLRASWQPEAGKGGLESSGFSSEPGGVRQAVGDQQGLLHADGATSPLSQLAPVLW